MDANLAIKIKVLVDGLKGIGDVGKALVDISKEIEKLGGLGDPLGQLGEKGKRAASDLEKAFKGLGGRATKEIQDDLQSIAEHLETVRKSGAGLEEVARAETLAAAATKRLNAELTNPAPLTFSQQLSNIGDKLRALDFKGVIADSKTLLEGFSGVTRLLGPLLGGFVALTGVKALGTLAAEAATLAARVETLGVTLDVVGRNAGYSKTSIDTLTNSLKAQGITTEAARSSLTQMIQAGIKVNELSDQVNKAGERITKAAELARAAQDLAVVSGENSSQTLQRLITNIQQRDTVGLRFMGLTVDMTTAEAKFAAQLGISATALTKSQQTQAFMNAVLAEATKLQGTYESALETTGKKLSSLQRYQDEFSLSLGNKLLPAYGALVDAATEYLKEATRISDEMSRTANVSGDLEKGLRPVADLLKNVAVLLTEISFQVFQGVASVIGQIGQALGETVQAGKDLFAVLSQAFNFGPEASNFMAALNPLKGFFTGLSLIVAAVRDGMSVLLGASLEVTSALAGGFAKILSMAAPVVGFFNKDLGDSMKKAAEDFKKFSDKTGELADKQIKKLNEGEGALATFADTYGKASDATAKTQANVTRFSASIEQLTAAQASNKISGAEFARQYDDISKSLLDTAGQAGLTKKEYTDLQKQLQASAGSLGKEFTEAAAAANLSLGELRTNATKEVSAGASALDALLKGAATSNEAILIGMGTSLKQVAQDVLNVYKQFADQARTIEDLTLLNGKLIEARKQGTINETEYQDALSRSAVKLNELLSTGLKSAVTQADYAKLTASVTELGNTGTLSSAQVEAGLQLIAREANKATGQFDKLAKAAQGVQISSAQVELARANYDVSVAQVSVAKSKNNLLLAELTYTREGGEVNRLNVEIARQQVGIAQQELELARVKAKESQSNLDLLISKQKVLNATVALQGKEADETLQANLALAQKQVETQQELNDNIKTAVNNQQEALLKGQEGLVLLEGQRDKVKDQADYWAKVTGNIQGANAAAGQYGNTLGGLKTPGSGGVAGGGGTISSGGGGGGGGGKGGTPLFGVIGADGKPIVTGNDNRGREAAVIPSGQPTKSMFGDTRADRLSGQNAVDNSLQFKLRDKLRTGQLGEGDLGDIDTVVKALAQNAQQNNQIDKHGSFISLEGRKDDLSWQNTARQLADAANSIRGKQQVGQANVASPEIVGGGSIAAIAPSAIAPKASAVSSSPSKKVQIDFTNGQKKVSAAVESGDDVELLKLLKQAQSRS